MSSTNNPEDAMKQQSKKWKLGLAIGAGIIVLGSTCLITGCGGGSSGGGNTPPVVTPPPVVAPSDPNGVNVRDDVRRYIETTQTSARVRAALFQYAKVMEKALADSGDKQLSIQHGVEASRASECDTYTLGDDVSAVHASYRMENELMQVILNTNERNRAYMAYNDHLGSEYFPATPHSQIASTCDIDPATLPN